MGTIMKTDSDNYNDIADAIREKSSSSDTYLPSEMGNAIRAIPQEGGGIGEDVITDEYDNTSTYSEGNYVMYNNELYICNTDINSPEEFDNTKWDKTNILSITPEFSVDENYIINTEKNQSPVDLTIADFTNGIIIKNQLYDFRNIYFAEIQPRPNAGENALAVVFPNTKEVGAAFSSASSGEHPHMIICYNLNSIQDVVIPQGELNLSFGYHKTNDWSTIVYMGKILSAYANNSFSLHTDLNYWDYMVMINTEENTGYSVFPFTSHSNSISYDNTTSGLTATNTQDAIDEIVNTIGDIESLLSNI